MGRLPVVRHTSWLGAMPQLIALGVLIVCGMWLARSVAGMLYGVAAYLALSYGSRALLTPHHKRGIQLARRQRYDEAIREYEKSYHFFSHHPWLDRFRSIFLFSASAASYREMALINIAYCHAQLGRGREAKSAYEKTLIEFPDNDMARSAMKFIRAVEQKRARSAARDEDSAQYR